MQITSDLTYLARAAWGARTDIPRLGHPVNRLDRTKIIVHHTFIIDNDATPNLWESLAEVKAKMVQLQTIRPDLGLDVPYSFVVFPMADGTLVVCEGRGLDRTGAHTHGHNTRGIGTGWQGNYDLAFDAGPYSESFSRFLGWMKYAKGMENLGTDHPVGRVAYGHEDLAVTDCPGDHLYAAIPMFSFQKGGLTMSEVSKLNARIDRLKATHDRNRSYRRWSSKLAGRAVTLTYQHTPAGAKTALRGIIAAANDLIARINSGQSVP